ncbi:helix-turn-helix domain-containing protein [Corynebacterium sp.]|uniref:helix-turn-helix domain-containing protein n=1 Tax=Corynebacterium sp. TaxID=1720 RepID=UPI0026DF589B|nr:helix-turn-helix transcriptional regulator [Corynebacterium sp.]MDO5512403.1 helix-turn-helix transcriptional regulator [Corynebacterium sp.]
MTDTDWDRDVLAVKNADSYAELTAQLFAIRKKRGLRQEDVANRMGTSKSAVSRIEAGHGNPTMRTLHDYAEAVGAYLAWVAVPEHHAAEWQERSRRNTDELQSRFLSS